MACGTFGLAQHFANKAEEASQKVFTQCEHLRELGDNHDCYRDKQEVFEAHTSKLQFGLWGFSAGLAAIYLTLAWIAFGILFGSFRWIMGGRARR